MKNTYKGFYNPSDNEIKKIWSEANTLFVFDANILLSLYGYTKDTRSILFKILEKLSERIWIPYHVGLEYQRNRLRIIKEEKENFTNLKKYIDGIDKIFSEKINQLNLEQRNLKLHEYTGVLQQNIQVLLKDYRKKIEYWDKKQPSVKSDDKIRTEINKFFKNKIGEKPKNQKWLNDIYAEGEKRYANEIPPGYKDKKEKANIKNYSFSNLEYCHMYGDLIIWKQIIEKAKEETIQSIIFISDDVKEDWVNSIDSRGKKIIGVRPELREEIMMNSKISLFEMMTTSVFMEEGGKNLDVAVSNKSVEEAESNFYRKNKLEVSLNSNKVKSEKNKVLIKVLIDIKHLMIDYISNTIPLNQFSQKFYSLFRLFRLLSDKIYDWRYQYEQVYHVLKKVDILIETVDINNIENINMVENSYKIKYFKKEIEKQLSLYDELLDFISKIM